MLLLVLVGGLLIYSADPRTDAASEFSQSTPKEAPLPFQVPEGFVAERVAGPPTVVYPMTANFDERGRLFVAHAAGRNVRNTAILLKELPNSIRLLQPADEKGRFHKFTVFADKMTFPSGALWYDGAFYGCSAPYIWKMQDTKGVDVADQRQRLVGKFNFDGHAADIKGPFLGPDGWLYWTDGYEGGQVRLDDGTMLNSQASRVFRCRTDGSGVEVVCGGGMHNPVMMTFTAEGEPLSTSTLINNYPARFDGLFYCIEGGVFPEESDRLAGFTRTGDLLPTVNLGHASPSGLTRYRSEVWGPEYRDNLFVTYYNTHKVQRLRLERDGAGFRVQTEDFIVSDSENFHPTFVLEDADGSLLVVDTGGWITVACYVSKLAPQAKGGIYRIHRKGAPKVEDPRGLVLPWEKLTASELAKLLDDPRFAVRDRAILYLSKQGAEARIALQEVLRDAASVQARRNAVWALTRMQDSAALVLLREALKDKDVSVRLSALRAVGLHSDGVSRPQLMELVVKDASPAVRRQAALALARIKHKEAVPALLEGLKTGPDPFLLHSLVYALIQTADREATLPGLHDSDPAVRRGALIALDKMESGNLTRDQISSLLDPAHPAVREAALKALIARPHWAKELSAIFRAWLLEDRLDGQQPEDLRRLLVAYCRDRAIQELIAQALRRKELPTETRLLLVEVIAQAPLDQMPSLWIAELRWCLEHSDPRIVRQAVADIRLSGVADFDEALLRLAADESRPADFRVEALAAAAPRIDALDDAHFHFLTACLDKNQPPLLRLAAAGALGQTGSSKGKSGLRGDQLATLTKFLADADPLELPRLLEVYERVHNRPITEKMIAALAKAPALESLTADAVRRTLQHHPEEVRQTARSVLARLEPGIDKMKARLTELTPVLKEGDGLRGQVVFFGKTAACSTCHTVNAQGGQVGPDLSKIGTVRSGADLLESVVFPSLNFVRGYEPYRVASKSGKVYPAGLLKRQTADAIYLVTGDRAEIRVPRSDIEVIEPGKVSIMPQGLDTQLSRQELADLLAFLQSLR